MRNSFRDHIAASPTLRSVQKIAAETRALIASTSPTPGRSWFVTGCSSGLGRALCERLLESGQKVVATARDVSKIEDFAKHFPDQVILARLDITDEASVTETVRAALSRGAVDVLVNNAGFGVVGALEEVDEQTVKIGRAHV